MGTVQPINAISKHRLWAGYVGSALPVVMLLFSGVVKLWQPEFAAIDKESARFGYEERILVILGVVEIACTLVYIVPRTAVLGAILLTGYLGGATATHVRIGDQFFMPILLGVLVWGGLYLRDERVRSLLPFRS